MEGISVVRANREIDFRKFDFYDNTGKNIITTTGY
jgi:hypothetical protein